MINFRLVMKDSEDDSQVLGNCFTNSELDMYSKQHNINWNTEEREKVRENTALPLTLVYVHMHDIQLWLILLSFYCGYWRKTIFSFSKQNSCNSSQSTLNKSRSSWRFYLVEWLRHCKDESSKLWHFVHKSIISLFMSSVCLWASPPPPPPKIKDDAVFFW